MKNTKRKIAANQWLTIILVY